MMHDIETDMDDPLDSAADLLVEEWLPEYESQIKAVHRQLLELSTRLLILEKLLDFPFWLFTPNTRDYMFWRATRLAMTESSIMIVSRVVVESGKGKLTLSNLRTDILEHAKDDSAKQKIVDRLREVSFEKRLEDVSKRIRHIRNNFIAHLAKEQQSALSDMTVNQERQLSFDHMKVLLEAAYDLLRVLAFNTSYPQHYFEYSEANAASENTDVDRLLDHVAETSSLLNLPETNPQAWHGRRLKLLASDISQFNRYRKKFGLPEA